MIRSILNLNGLNCCRCNKSLSRTQNEFGYFESEEERKGFEASRSKSNITCTFVSGIYIGDSVFDEADTLQIQRLFPHEWLTNKEV